MLLNWNLASSGYSNCQALDIVIVNAQAACRDNFDGSHQNKKNSMKGQLLHSGTYPSVKDKA